MTLRPGRLLFTLLAVGLPVVFVLLPILSFVLISFWRLDDGQIVHEFTLANYAAFVTSGGFLDVYLATLLLCAEVTLLNVAIGTAVAVFLVRRPPRLRLGLLMAFVLPLFMSYIIKIYSIRGILGQRGLLNELLVGLGVIDQPLTVLLFSRTAIFLTLAIIYLPYAILPVYLAMEKIPTNLLEASADLGGGWWQELRHVVLPLARPGLVATGLLVLILSWNEYLLALFLSNANAQTMPVLVAAQNATRGPQWWYMSVLILLMILPVIFLTLLLQRFIAKGLLLGAVKG
jgi:spermidine/putrescine transport system permease protein